jgi:2-oxoisovalerate dehydrogenase E1 component alpha subunit
MADQDFFDGVQAEADELAARVREFCVNMPQPGPERIFSHVYVEESPPLAAQREEYLAYHASFAEVSGGEG